MPILNSAHKGWFDPDAVLRPVVTFGFTEPFVGKIELAPHRHRKAQIMLVQRGALSCEVDGGLWIVPPRSAIWIPGGALHAVNATGTLEGYNAFIDPEADARLPRICCAVSVTPLLRELLIRSAHMPALYEEGGAEARLVAGLRDRERSPGGDKNGD